MFLTGTLGGSMKVFSLEVFGVHDQDIDVWRSTGHEELLPVQELAVRKHGALDGGNVLVFSPTSSGKTFIGEMAAVKKARDNRHVLYLVPQKALAEEKYREFHRKYAPLGIRTVISSRDRREFDQDIERGRFHIAVVVFEKMQGLLVLNPKILDDVGLVVVDELQMIGDRSRGAGLEILLTKIRTAKRRPQFIGLSAVLGNANRLAKWLGAELCRTRCRPVELRKGVLFGGKFRYVEHNSGGEGREELAPTDTGEDPSEALVRQVASFAEAGEQCLVFCKTRKECVSTAAAIAKRLAAERADGAYDELRELEDSEGKDILLRLLSRGAAYHNSDLDRDQRDVIERHFRRGGIKALCATSTLAMGMNLPAKNVFVDPRRWERGRTGRWTTVSISQGEYENMSGRAGRLGLEDGFGRAIIVPDSPFDADTFLDYYAKGRVGRVEPTLDDDPLAHHVLNLIASGLCRTAREVERMLLSSFTGELCWRGDGHEEEFLEKLKAALRFCLDGGLIERVGRGRILATRLGERAAMKGITVETAIALAHFARANSGPGSGVYLIEILLCLARTEDAENAYISLSKEEHKFGKYLALLKDRGKELPEKARERLSKVEGLIRVDYDAAKQAKKALLLYEWVTGVTTREIEKRFRCYSGAICHLAQEFSWLAEALADVAGVCGWGEKRVDRLQQLARQLLFGVSGRGIKLAAMRVRGLGRAKIGRLVEAGIDRPEKVAAAEPVRLQKLVGKRLAARLLKRAAEIIARAHAREAAVEGEQAGGAAPGPAKRKAGFETTFPLADPAGAPYLSTARLHVDGSVDGKRYLVKVNDGEAWLTAGPFVATVKLAVRALTTELGWRPGPDLGGKRYHQYVSRLKQELDVAGERAAKLIENNRAKEYRFSVPRANVTIDVETVLESVPGLSEELAPFRRPAKRRRSSRRGAVRQAVAAGT
jgi:helicase